MDAVMVFLSVNWWWLLIIGFCVGGTFFEWLGGAFSTLFKSFGQRRGLKAQIKDLKRQLKAKNEELNRAHKLLGVGGRSVIASLPTGNAGTEPRMARLLDRVQATDSALPQLPLNLREEIDAELERYYTGPKQEKS